MADEVVQMIVPWYDESVTNADPPAPVPANPSDFDYSVARQLPDSGVITMDDIRQEVSVAGTCNLNQQEFRDLIAPRNSGEQQAMSEYYGKSATKVGEGEMGTSGNCFAGFNRSDGTSAISISSSAWNNSGYCGRMVTVATNHNRYGTKACYFDMPFLMIYNGSKNIRFSYRGYTAGAAGDTWYDPKYAWIGQWMWAVDGRDFGFDAQFGANHNSSGAHRGSFLVSKGGKYDTLEVRYLINSSGGSTQFTDGAFSRDIHEHSFINKSVVTAKDGDADDSPKSCYLKFWADTDIGPANENGIAYVKVQNA